MSNKKNYISLSQGQNKPQDLFSIFSFHFSAK